MSETTGATTVHTFNKFNLDSAGWCLPGTDLRIDNPDENGEGEICMRGRNTMMGYLKNEKATIDTLDEQGYIKSGDKGKIDAQGFLKITGRIKELIITAGGENIGKLGTIKISTTLPIYTQSLLKNLFIYLTYIIQLQFPLKITSKLNFRTLFPMLWLLETGKNI